jgi:hypothetical protein
MSARDAERFLGVRFRSLRTFFVIFALDHGGEP